MVLRNVVSPKIRAGIIVGKAVLISAEEVSQQADSSRADSRLQKQSHVGGVEG